MKHFVQSKVENVLQCLFTKLFTLGTYRNNIHRISKELLMKYRCTGSVLVA